MYTKEERRYVLDVTKTNDDYSYVLKDKHNNKENNFNIESGIQPNIGASNAFDIRNKINNIQDKTAFNEAIKTITSLH